MAIERTQKTPHIDSTSSRKADDSLTPSRLIVKLGTSLLTAGTEQLTHSVIGLLVKQVGSLYHQGWEILIVSSGAVAAGRQIIQQQTERRPFGWSRRSPHEVSMRQVQAAVGQSHLMAMYEELFHTENISVAQALLTERDIADKSGYLNIRNTLTELLNLGIVPIINENDVVAVEEIQGEVIGDNDMLSAKLARIVEADLLILLSDIQGLYTADPNLDPDAELIRFVNDPTKIEVIAGDSSNKLGTGGMATKLAAAKLAVSSGTTTIIADGQADNVLVRLGQGESVGTRFTSQITHLQSRENWILSMPSNTGQIKIQGGIIHELIKDHFGISSIHIKDFHGSFTRGDAVQIIDNHGIVVALGISNYASTEIGFTHNNIGDDQANLIKDPKIIIHGNNIVLRNPEDYSKRWNNLVSNL